MIYDSYRLRNNTMNYRKVELKEEKKPSIHTPYTTRDANMFVTRRQTSVQSLCVHSVVNGFVYVFHLNISWAI